MRTNEKNAAVHNDTANIDGGLAGFMLQTANAWLRESKLRPIPKRLFGEYWLEGELAIMFADTGKGKSIMAVQIAEAIARGDGVGPIAVDSTAQSVLLIDCELSAKQFEMRYSAEPEPGAEFLSGHYEFSDNFHRAQ
ncbi:MAG: AAA family ATPase, partial [Pyrinomonadaceae bacterium]